VTSTDDCDGPNAFFPNIYATSRDNGGKTHRYCREITTNQRLQPRIYVVAIIIRQCLLLFVLYRQHCAQRNAPVF